MSLSPLFTVLQGIASIIGIVWLLLLGEWMLILMAVFVSVGYLCFLFPLIYFIIFVLAQFFLVFFLVDSRKDIEQKIESNTHIIGNTHIEETLSTVVGYGINFVWAIAMFRAALNWSIGQSPIPYLILGFDVAVGPLQFMALNEPPLSESHLSLALGVCLTALLYLILTISFFLGILSFY